MKLQMQRQLFGLHMPMRILMERKIVSHVRPHLPPLVLSLRRLHSRAPQNPHMPILPQSNLHLDILMGRDETLECADFMGSGTILLLP